MQGVNNEMQTPYTASVDYKGDGVTTGISADDRYKTIKALSNPASKMKTLIFQVYISIASNGRRCFKKSWAYGSCN